MYMDVYMNFEGKLTKYEDIPEHLRSLIPKEAKYFHEHTIGPTTKYTRCIIDIVNKSPGLGSIGDVPNSVSLRGMQFNDLARRKAKELARGGESKPIDTTELINSLSEDNEMVQEHNERLKKIKGVFGVGRVPTEQIFEKHFDELKKKSNSSIIASKTSGARIIDQWQKYLGQNTKKASQANQDLKDREFIHPINILQRLAAQSKSKQKHPTKPVLAETRRATNRNDVGDDIQNKQSNDKGKCNMQQYQQQQLVCIIIIIIIIINIIIITIFIIIYTISAAATASIPSKY